MSREAELLAAIADGDDAMRAVYADWLEEQGDAMRAEYLRLHDALIFHDARRAPHKAPPRAHELRAENAFDQTARDLALLASGIDAAWRARVDAPAIELWLLAKHDLGWLRAALADAARRPARPFQLPDELRYLEGLAPKGPVAPVVMSPRR